MTDSHSRKLSQILNKTLNDNKNDEISTFFKPNGKIIHMLASISAEAVNMDKNYYLITICGTNDFEYCCTNADKLICEFKDE